MTFYDVAATSSNYNPAGFIKFFNDESFIKVYNGQTGVYSYVNKDNIVIQRDSVSSFFLKSGDYIVYFNYHDVSYPRSTDLKDLLAILSDWCRKALLNNNSIVDMMNRLRTTTFSNVLTVSTVHDKSPLLVDEISSIQGEQSTLLTNSVLMATTASNGSYLVRQTKHYAQHIYGGTSIAMVSGVLAMDPAASNVRTRIGVFDDQANVTEPNAGPHGNGMFFQWDNSNGVTCVYRTNLGGSQVDTMVLRENWNQNNLIDSGTDGYTMHPNSNTTFVFEWNNHDLSRPARCGILNAGAITYVHQFSGSNVPGFFGNPSLPIRWEVAHAADIGPVPSAQQVVQGCATVITDMDGRMPSRMYAKDSGTLFKTLNAAGSIPLFSLRLATAYARSKLHARKLCLVNAQQGAIAKWLIVLNGDLTDATWTAVDSNSSWAEFSNTEVSCTGGTVLSTGFLVGSGVTEVDLADKLPALSSKMTGRTDTLTVVVSYVQGTTVVNGGIEWVEME